MARFRKKPVVIDATQWFPGTKVDGVTEVPDVAGTRGMVVTLEGALYASPGDWIITGTKGEKYPCKPDIFAEIYEPATTVQAGR